MKKITLLSAFLVVFTFNTFSQDKGYIGISLGSSTPVGDFASKDPENKAAGFAKTGAIFDLSFGYKLGKNFGVAALLRGQANSVDAQSLKSYLENQNPGFTWTVDAQSWSIGGYMGGGYASFPISDKFSFESRVLVGFLNATSPDIKFTLDATGSWVKQKSSSSSTFAYLLGAGFKYDIGNRLCLLANFDYLTAKPEFVNVETVSSTGSVSKDTFTQTFGTINFGVGLGFRL